MFDVNDIQLPSPYHYVYLKNKDVWNQTGFWQNQWRAYLKGAPSVYTGSVPLPSPFGEIYRPTYNLRVWFRDRSGLEAIVPINQ